MINLYRSDCFFENQNCRVSLKPRRRQLKLLSLINILRQCTRRGERIARISRVPVHSRHASRAAWHLIVGSECFLEVVSRSLEAEALATEHDLEHWPSGGLHGRTSTPAKASPGRAWHAGEVPEQGVAGPLGLGNFESQEAATGLLEPPSSWRGSELQAACCSSPGVVPPKSGGLLQVGGWRLASRCTLLAKKVDGAQPRLSPPSQQCIGSLLSAGMSLACPVCCWEFLSCSSSRPPSLPTEKPA